MDVPEVTWMFKDFRNLIWRSHGHRHLGELVAHFNNSWENAVCMKLVFKKVLTFLQEIANWVSPGNSQINGTTAWTSAEDLSKYD